MKKATAVADKPRPFLSDIKTLRARARKHVADGAVTPVTARTAPPC